MQKVNTQTVSTERGPTVTQGMGTQSNPVPEIYKHLNFKVPPEFHREFKTWAASHDMSMTALLVEAFNIMRKQYSG